MVHHLVVPLYLVLGGAFLHRTGNQGRGVAMRASLLLIMNFNLTYETEARQKQSVKYVYVTYQQASLTLTQVFTRKRL